MNDTAFEWFLKNIPERFRNAFLNSCQEEIQKTRELEKSQIVDSHADGIDHDLTDLDKEFGMSDSDRQNHGEKYYNQIYNQNK
jgi:hypothetical protein